MANSKFISVYVCYATKINQEVVKLNLPCNCTVLQAIKQSGFLDKYSEIDLTKNKIGVHAKFVSLDKILENNDRVEIYRDLSVNPIDARRQRAEQQKIDKQI